MKILFVVQNYYPSIGGSQILFQKIAETCVKEYGDEATVFTTNSYFGPNNSRHFKRISTLNEIINGVSVKRFSFYRFHIPVLRFISQFISIIFHKRSELFSMWMSGPWSPSLRKAIENTNADIIFAGTSNYLYMHYPQRRDRLKNKKPFIFQGAVHFKEDRNEKVIYSKALQSMKMSDAYFANTTFEKNRLVELGLQDDKVFISGLGIDISLFKNGDRNIYRDKFNLQNDDILIGYIGRVEGTKSIDVLIDAFQLCYRSNQNITLVIAGYQNPEYILRIQAIINNLEEKIQTQIHIIRDLDDEQKNNLFYSLDIFVSPSVNESFGMVFLEAWACEKPVIGSSIGAIRSVISEGVDGFLFSPGNAEDLATKILLLANDPATRKSFGENGYKKTITNFTLSAVTKKYRDVFLKVKEMYNVH